ncbi:3D domain-containing protein [Listeria seeligeri]|uniref:3D domain-containing protein n=1 Tax=Listeria seeligeri TaxID=1640 RepID=UPI001629E62A|nr:3D domain-containing protein [Listeria seeligeri]MBC1832307.1 hypothetical protein [Listeria seeligeri]MBC1851154.1 hypothetical protein [Listeria seeligeri]MBC1929362.1 hypothetical protein [Listeria seeligeri]MBF2370250.1 3D domain-containing protein [Listeria seeligeri]MBF2390447.1 3D domain-containing protein [Listeria seeligeri]
MQSIIASILLTASLSAGAGPQIPAKETSEVAQQVMPNAQTWQSNAEASKTKAAELEEKLAERNQEIEHLKKQLSSSKVKTTPEVKTEQTGVKTPWRTGEFTAYYPPTDVSEHAMQGNGITAQGDNLHKSQTCEGYQIVAAPPEIPFDTKLEIEVNGTVIKAIVRDRGGAIRGSKFDIALPNRSSAVDFGRQSGKWRIIE